MKIIHPVMDLSIVLIAWKSRSVIEACLDSIFNRTHRIKFEVILVDDESGDGTPEFVEQHYPDVRLIRGYQRLGIGPSRNLGLSQANGRYLLLLDVDTEVLGLALDCIVEFMDANQDVGICGCKLLYPSGELQYTCRTFTTPLVLLFRRTPLSTIFPNAPILRRYLMGDWDHNSVREVDYVAGACMMVRREAFEQVGYMAPYFHGPEDQEYCYRVHRAGWKVIYYPDAQIIHHYRRVSARGSIINRMALIQLREMLDFYKEMMLDKLLQRPLKCRDFSAG